MQGFFYPRIPCTITQQNTTEPYPVALLTTNCKSSRMYEGLSFELLTEESSATLMTDPRRSGQLIIGITAPLSFTLEVGRKPKFSLK